MFIAWVELSTYIFFLYKDLYKIWILTECRDPPKNILNGKVIVNKKTRSDKTVVGTSITIKCKYGYGLLTRDSEYICQEDGNWNQKLINIKCLEGYLS